MTTGYMFTEDPKPGTLITALPTHVLEDVFCRLDCHSLARCCAVSRAWRTAAAAEAPWRQQLLREFGLPASPPLRPSVVVPPQRLPAANLTFKTAECQSNDTKTAGEATIDTLTNAVSSASASGAARTLAGRCSAADVVAKAATGTVLPSHPEGTAPRTVWCPLTDASGSQEPSYNAFRRLMVCPLATHMSYVRRLDTVVQHVTAWTVRVAHRPQPGRGYPYVLRVASTPCLGQSVTPQSLWLRFRLPTWVRRAARKLAPWEPGLVSAAAGACGGSDGTGLMERSSAAQLELTVLARGQDGRSWPVLHSSPFWMPEGDRNQLLQSHVEGLYIWNEEDYLRVGEGANEVDESSDSDPGRAGDDGEDDPERDVVDYGGQPARYDTGGGGGGEKENVKAKEDEGDGRDRQQHETKGAPSASAAGSLKGERSGERRRRRQGPHLVAYLHYEQLLPVCPAHVLSTQEGLDLHRQPPPRNHPGYGTCAARMAAKQRSSVAAQPRSQPAVCPPLSAFAAGQEDAMAGQQAASQERAGAEPQAGPAAQVGAQPTAGAQPKFQGHRGNRNANLGRASGPGVVDASGTTGGTAGGTADTPRPTAYLYVDFSRLPPYKDGDEDEDGKGGPSPSDAAAGGAGNGWVQGCVVRLWHLPTRRPLVVQPSLENQDVQSPVSMAYGDSRQGDVVLISRQEPPPTNLPTVAAAAAPTLRAGPSLSAAALGSGSSVAGGVTVTERSVATEFTEAWLQAFGAGCDVERFAAGSDAAAISVAWARGSSGGGDGSSGGGSGGSDAAGAAWGADVRRGAEAAACLNELCDRDVATMADFSLLDSTGRVRLGRCGVELWTASASSTSLHFLLDQLPPARQSLWSNAILFEWGRGSGGGGSGGSNDGDRAGPGSGGGGGDGAAAGGSGGGGGLSAGGEGREDGNQGVEGHAGGGGGPSEPSRAGCPGTDPWVRVTIRMPIRHYELMYPDPGVESGP